MSKICFVTMGNLYLCPYLESYTKHLDVEYDVVYWDRDILRRQAVLIAFIDSVVLRQ